MRVKVVIAPVGAGQTAQETLSVQCDSGQQILRWLACAACAQLAFKQGEVVGCYVPQAVTKNGTVLDVDLVLSEVAADNDELGVEYSSGPLAFTTRWERRPRSPPLTCDDDLDGSASADASPSAWLEEWDPAAEGLASLTLTHKQPQHAQQQHQQHTESPGSDLVQPAGVAQQDGQQQQQPPPPPQQQQQQQQQAQAKPTDPQHQDLAGMLQADLRRVRDVLQQHAGALQMLFLLFTSEAAAPMDVVSRMSLAQFKSVLQAAKVTAGSGGLAPEHLGDELFMAVQAAPGSLARKGQASSSPGGLDIADFLVALVQVAHIRFEAESFITGASNTPLSTKLLSLLQDCVCAHLFPELQRRLDKLRSAATPAAKALLRKGRRLTEQVLERCQVRRVRARGLLTVPVAYVVSHLERWGLLGREFSLHDLAPVIIFAKQASSDPYRFVLHREPLALDYDEFDKLLLGIAVLQARIRKRPDAVDEMLGELLDTVFRKSGVLLVSLPASSQ